MPQRERQRQSQSSNADEPWNDFAERFNRDLLPFAKDFSKAIAIRVFLASRCRRDPTFTASRAMVEARSSLDLIGDNAPLDSRNPIDVAYHAFRIELREESERAKLTPAQVSMYLEARQAEFPDHIRQYEIDAYRESPDDWRGVVL